MTNIQQTAADLDALARAGRTDVYARRDRCIAGMKVARAQIDESDRELEELGRAYEAGEVTALFVKIKEAAIRERRAQAQQCFNALDSVRPHF